MKKSYAPEEKQALIDRYLSNKEPVGKLLVSAGVPRSTFYGWLQAYREVQQFDTSKPNEVWVGDVTYFKLGSHAYHISVIIDLFSRMVIAYRIGKTNSTQLVKSTFKKAYFDQKPPEGLIFHTDRGSNYMAKTMQDYLRSVHVTHSFSRVGSPHDNSVIESFFASFKKEELFRRIYRSEAEFRAAIDDYILFYNTKRLHEKLQYKTPQEWEKEYMSKENDGTNVSDSRGS